MENNKDDVYNYFLPSYSPRPMTRYDSHESSELRSVVKSIRDMTQSSPLYLVHLSEAKQKYALEIKDAAISFINTLKMLGETGEDSVFSQRKAHSSNLKQIGARIVTEDYSQLPEPPVIKVNRLATTQVNMGNEYYATGKGLQAGLYRFRISVNEDNYDFQYNIRKDAHHREIMEGLSSFINKAKIGLTASAVSRSADKILMRIESDMTGAPGGGNIFYFEDKQPGQGIASYYNLNNVTSYPKNASFDMNGVPQSTLGNTFTIGRALEISLYAAGDEPVKVSYIPDSDKILEGVHGIMESYNKLVDSTREYISRSGLKPRLVQEFCRLMVPFQSDMESCGIYFDEDGNMKMDEALAEEAALSGDMEALFGREYRLNQKLQRKNNEIKINPMDYVDKILVSYPNFEKPPEGLSYITSIYSGMLFSYYC